MIRRALARGWRKRCPHCGQGPLFAGRWTHLERCSHCGLVFERNPGDTWAFTIVGDRLPIAAIVVVIYFGLVRQHRALGLAVIILLGIAIVWTANARPERPACLEAPDAPVGRPFLSGDPFRVAGTRRPASKRALAGI
jgi:uncharacterized protein (DUF983 family)